MIKDLRHTFKQTAIYGISNVLIKATGLILLPIYTSELSANDYGILVMLEIIAQLFVGVISFHIPASILRFGSEESTISRQNQIYFTGWMMLLGVVTLFILISLPLSGIFSEVMFDTPDYRLYFILLFCSIGVEILGILPLQLMRLKEQSTKYLLFFLVKLLGMLGFVSYFIIIREMGVLGAVLGIFLGNALMWLATIPFQLQNIVARFDKVAAKSIYRYGAPLVFSTIAGIALTVSDRAIIKYYGAFADVGIYSVAYKIGSIANLLVIGSFTLGFLPIAFKKFHDPNFSRFFSKMFTYFIGIIVLLTLGVSIFSKEIIKVISSDAPEFWFAVILVPFIGFTFIFKALQFYMAFVFYLTKETKYDAFITGIGAVIIIVINFLLIPIWGMYGAIAATGTSYIVMGLITYRIAQKKFHVSYEFKRIFGLLITCALFIVVGYIFNSYSILTRLIVKSLLVFGFIFAMYQFFIDHTEKQKIRKTIILLRQPGGIKKLLQEISG